MRRSTGKTKSIGGEKLNLCIFASLVKPLPPPLKNINTQQMNKLPLIARAVSGERRALYEPPTAEFFATSVPQNILVQMSIELDVSDFEEGEDL